MAFFQDITINVISALVGGIVGGMFTYVGARYEIRSTNRKVRKEEARRAVRILHELKDQLNSLGLHGLKFCAAVDVGNLVEARQELNKLNPKSVYPLVLDVVSLFYDRDAVLKHISCLSSELMEGSYVPLVDEFNNYIENGKYFNLKFGLINNCKDLIEMYDQCVLDIDNLVEEFKLVEEK